MLQIAPSGPLRALHIDSEEIAHSDHHSDGSCCHASLLIQVHASSPPATQVSLPGPTEELLIGNSHFSSGLRLRTTKRPQRSCILVV